MEQETYSMWIYDRPEDPRSNPFRQDPFVTVTQISYIREPFPWDQFPHFHKDEYELAVLNRGTDLVSLPGCIRELGAGDLLIVPPEIAHCHNYREEELQMHTIRFRAAKPEALCPLWNGRKTGIVSCPTASSQIHQLLLIVQEIAGENGGLIDGRIQSLSLSVLAIAAEQFGSSGTVIETSAPVYANDILLYLQQNIGRKITMEDLSEEFHLSPSHISRVFQKTYHTSPIHYLIYCRMRQARTYLLNEGLSAKEIAGRLAYPDVYAFIQAFKKFYGCRPEEYQG